MSGGSWDYVYQRFEGVSGRLISSKEPLRRALGKKIALIADAMHDIEWVDSCDLGKGDDVKSIEKALGKDARLIELDEVCKEAHTIRDRLGELLELTPPTKGEAEK